MSDYDNAIFRLATEPEPEDYTGENGLLYCGSCRQPKEAYFPEGKVIFGRDRHPRECDCQRKRRARRALQEQKALPEAVADKRPPDGADICPPEIEIEKEIDIELEIKREGELKKGQTAPAPFGRYENVFLSEKELAELQEELPGKWEYYIDRLSGYIASSGKKYKNHAATIRRWAADDRAKGKPKKGIPDYSYKEGESL